MKPNFLAGIFIVSAVTLFGGCETPKMYMTPRPSAPPSGYTQNRTYSPSRSLPTYTPPAGGYTWQDVEGERHLARVVERNPDGTAKRVEISPDCPCSSCRSARDNAPAVPQAQDSVPRRTEPMQALPLPSQMPAVPQAQGSELRFDSSIKEIDPRAGAALEKTERLPQAD